MQVCSIDGCPVIEVGEDGGDVCRNWFNTVAVEGANIGDEPE